jgi:dTDP-4-amino-4,6-dideoxygalactose transaminase
MSPLWTSWDRYNYRMSNISAGIGRGQMNVLVKHIKLRRMMNFIWIYSRNLTVCLSTLYQMNYFANYWLTAILINPKDQRNKNEIVRLKLLDEKTLNLARYGNLCIDNLSFEYPYMVRIMLLTVFWNGALLTFWI